MQHELDVAKQAIRNAVEAIEAVSKLDTSLKHDGSPVTRADVAANEAIVQHLRTHFPTDGIVSEELEKIDGTRTWFVDPIDGTKSFIAGGNYTIHVGLCIANQPVVGVIYDPIHDTWWYASPDGAFKETQQGVEQLRCVQKSLQVGVSPTTLSAHVQELFEKNNIQKILRAASAGLRSMLVVENKAEVYVNARGKRWDLCAPHAILVAAGGFISKINGELDYSKEIPDEHIVIMTASQQQYDTFLANM